MEGNKEEVKDTVVQPVPTQAAAVPGAVPDVEGDENYDDSDGYVKAKTFPIDDNWPEEIKQQVRQLNQMSEMLNAEPEDDDDDDDDEEDVDADDDTEESDNSSNSVTSEETETFDNVF